MFYNPKRHHSFGEDVFQAAFEKRRGFLRRRIEQSGGTDNDMESSLELTIDQALQRAVDAHQAGKLPEAEGLYRAILQAQPTHPDANHNLGVLAVTVNQVSAALPFFRTALEINPSQGQYWLSYLDALIKAGEIDEARRVLVRGKTLGLAGEPVVALEARLLPVPQAPEVGPTIRAQGISLKEQRKRMAEKKQQRKQSTRIDSPRLPSPSQADSERLLACYKRGAMDEAKAMALAMTRKYPQHPFGWTILGAVLYSTGAISDAFHANRKVVQLAPNDADAHNNLGIMLKELGRLEEAEASYRSAIALKPDFSEAHFNLGNALSDLGRLEEAEASYRTVLILRPDNADAHVNLGNALRDRGRLEEAETSYRNAISLRPDFSGARINLGNALRDLGRLEEAAASYRTAVTLKPDNVDAYINLGNALTDLGRLEEAEASCRTAITLQPDAHGAHINLGNVLKDLGRLAEAEASYRTAITLKPDEADAHSNLGSLLIDQGNLVEARSRLIDGLNQVSRHQWSIASSAMIVSWILGMHPELQTYAREHVLAVPHDTPKNLKPNKAFFLYMKALSEHCELHPQLYQEAAKGASLVVVGESHSLGPHGLEFSWIDSAPVLATCCFVKGLKMFHLGTACNKKFYQGILSRRMKEVKPRSHLMFTIGEIDCRQDEGIWRAHQKTGRSLDDLVAKTVEEFLSWLGHELGGLDYLSVVIQGVPAPHQLDTQALDKDLDQFLGMIKAVNHHLLAGARSRGWKFLDVYSATVGPDGKSHGRWHLDGVHLQPKFYEEANQWLR